MGIVKLKTSSVKFPIVLESCNIVGGEGALPTAAGNRWKYISLGNNEFKEDFMDVEITYSQNGRSFVKYTAFMIKHNYDENNFKEMMSVAAEKYWDEEKDDLTKESEAVAYEYLGKAKKIARTDLQKAHNTATKNVMDRVFMLPELKPDLTEKGIWNLFITCHTEKRDSVIDLIDEPYQNSGETQRFQWIVSENGEPDGVHCNFSYDIIQNILDCMWDDKWVDGYETVAKTDLWGIYKLASPVKVNAVSPLIVAGEEFKNCLCVAFECKEQENTPKVTQAQFRGPQEYYYAPGVGIVRMVHHCVDGKTTTYDLTKYSGTGEGYFPIVDGMVRHYEAVDLDKNYRAYSEYTFVKDEDGSVKIYGDLCRMRKVNPEEK